MSLPPLPDDAIVLGADAVDWRAAVRLAGDALARSGATTAGYADEMIRMIQQRGPYVVIAPGLALAHARPGPEVLGDGLAVVTLSRGVAFGHPHNDPVTVVIALASASASQHLAAVAAVANVFNDETSVARLEAAKDIDDVRLALG
jgi:PTS system ascorbate-specific IIA component